MRSALSLRSGSPAPRAQSIGIGESGNARRRARYAENLNPAATRSVRAAAHESTRNVAADRDLIAASITDANPGINRPGELAGSTGLHPPTLSRSTPAVVSGALTAAGVRWRAAAGS